MKDYFVKYLEVTDTMRCNQCYWEGDPDDNECPSCKTDGYLMHPFMKLFFCSRDIQSGDELIDEKGNTFIIDNGNINSLGKTIQGYKVIGEVSPKAFWIKETDEFDESDFKLFKSADVYHSSIISEYLEEEWMYKEDSIITPRSICIVYFQCPTCNTFH